GNVALKTMEGVAGLIADRMRQEFRASWLDRLAGAVAAPALRRAAAGLDPRRYNGACMVGLDGIVVKSHGRADGVAFARAIGTASPDLVFPNCGTLLQQRLGCRGIPAFSLETACAGFMYALSIADKYVRCGESKRALVIGAETLSRITDWKDRSTAVLFADGAGAVVLEPSAQPGLLSTHLHSDGQYKDLLYCAGGVS